MSTVSQDDLLELYRTVVADRVLRHRRPNARRGIYEAAVVIWLMIVQRLESNCSLNQVVHYLASGHFAALLWPCRRVRQGRISCSTGGYSRARKRLPKLVFAQMNQEVTERLRQQLSEPFDGLDGPVFVLDGSSLQLPHTPELVRAFPPGHNQRGESHWPVIRITVAHDLRTGMAQQPCWGPMYGSQAVSEQGLAQDIIAALPAGAAVMGDRNFGIFSIAAGCAEHKRPVLLRLTEVRAKKVAGQAISTDDLDQQVVWRASRSDRNVSQVTEVSGRLIARRVGRGKSKQWLYLFTTMTLPAGKIVALYGLRWHIETDLRSLKRTVNLHHITGKTIDMAEKELLTAISTYNLVRAVMCMAGRRAGVHPRRLSFTRVLSVLNAAWPKLLAASSDQEHHREFDRVVNFAAQCLLPQRKKNRVYPRAVWSHGEKFPNQRSPKTHSGEDPAHVK